MEKYIKATFLMAESTGTVFINGQIIHNLKVYIKMILSMGLENIQIQMERFLKENGSMEKDKDKELWS